MVQRHAVRRLECRLGVYRVLIQMVCIFYSVQVQVAPFLPFPLSYFTFSFFLSLFLLPYILRMYRSLPSSQSAFGMTKTGIDESKTRGLNAQPTPRGRTFACGPRFQTNHQWKRKAWRGPGYGIATFRRRMFGT